MGAILIIISIILFGILAFVVLGLLGWGIQLLGFIGNFLGEGITGCLGCICKFFWVILVGIILIGLLL